MYHKNTVLIYTYTGDTIRNDWPEYITQGICVRSWFMGGN